MNLIHVIILFKILFSLNLKYSSFLPSADVQPMSNDPLLKKMLSTKCLKQNCKHEQTSSAHSGKRDCLFSVKLNLFYRAWEVLHSYLILNRVHCQDLGHIHNTCQTRVEVTYGDMITRQLRYRINYGWKTLGRRQKGRICHILFSL
jgi:hypothetical protein